MVRVALVPQCFPYGVRRRFHNTVHLSVAPAERWGLDNGNHDLWIGVRQCKCCRKLHAVETAVAGNFGEGDFALPGWQGAQAGFAVRSQHGGTETISGPKRLKLDLVISVRNQRPYKIREVGLAGRDHKPYGAGKRVRRVPAADKPHDTLAHG